MIRRLALSLLLVAVLVFPSRAHGQAAGPARASAYVAAKGEFQPKINPEVSIRRTGGPITIDGQLDDPGWVTAAKLTGFTEIQPQQMVAAKEETEVFVTYDASKLYIAFRSYGDPRTIRASLSNRDDIFQDDWVGIVLDTYGDATQALEIFANPLGVQGDLLMTPGGEDVGFDLIYETAGRITSTGFELEMAIPFSSLRFPKAEEHVWRITFLRNYPRESRRLFSWAAVTDNNPCLLCQAGTLRGIRDIQPSTRAEILPAIVATQSGSLGDEEDPTTSFDNGRAHPEASLNLRYNVTSSLAAEAAINPDFSQIESDAAQIDVNETFALYYPERRPFFQQGSDLFQAWIPVIYTRSINDPIGAAKVTGRYGPTNMAFVSAVDEHTPILLPFEEKSELVEGGRSLTNIIRARHSFGTNSFVGGTVTDRRLLDGGSGSLVSSDLQVQLLGNYILEAQGAFSHTAEPDRPELTEDLDPHSFGDGRSAAFDGESFSGSALFLSFDRRSRHWNFDLAYEGVSPAFRAANGFITRNSYRLVRMFQSYDFYPHGRILDRITPSFSVRRGYNFDGVRKLDAISPQIYGMLKGQTYFELGYTYSRERFQGIEFDGLHSWNAGFESNFSRWLTAEFFVRGGREIARSEDIPEIGRQIAFHAELEFKPTRRLVVEPSFDYAQLRDLETRRAFFKGYILRTETSFQFTREFSSRIILQYNHFDGRLALEPLLSYQVNPFSILYLGSTHDYVSFDRPYGVMQARRQFFFKFQYLFRT